MRERRPSSSAFICASAQNHRRTGPARLLRLANLVRIAITCRMSMTWPRLRSFISNTRKTDYRCSWCGESEVIYNAAEPGTPAVLDVAVTDTENHHQFYSVSCTNCGRTDFFHINMVNRVLGPEDGDGE